MAAPFLRLKRSMQVKIIVRNAKRILLMAFEKLIDKSLLVEEMK